MSLTAKPPFSLSKPTMDVTITLTNNSNSPMRIREMRSNNTNAALYDYVVTVSRVSASGQIKPVSRRSTHGIIVNDMLNGSHSMLAAHDCISQIVDLKPVFQIDKPGTYVIQASRHALPATLTDFIKSNTLTLTVTK